MRITNLQQMAETLIYVQEHGYDSRTDLDAALSAARTGLSEQEETLGNLASQMKTLNSQIHYTGQYYASKKTYGEFLKSKQKRNYKKAHEEEIRKYLEARDWLKEWFPDGFAGYVFPRSSLTVKGLVCELPPIDSGYRGEIHAIISNVSSVRQTIKKDTRIGQLFITPVVIADFVLDFGEERGTGAFGSTGE